MFRSSNENGYTLLELLIVVAILGVIAAVGVPLYGDYVINSKETVAKNNLRSIYLMEQDYYNENNSYCTTRSSERCGSTRQINQYLFGGQKTLDESEPNYRYFVNNYGSGYRAYAQPKSSGLTRYCIDHNNSLGRC